MNEKVIRSPLGSLKLEKASHKVKKLHRDTLVVHMLLPNLGVVYQEGSEKVDSQGGAACTKLLSFVCFWVDSSWLSAARCSKSVCENESQLQNCSANASGSDSQRPAHLAVIVFEQPGINSKNCA
jgi:hypothetical protein